MFSTHLTPRKFLLGAILSGATLLSVALGGATALHAAPPPPAISSLSCTAPASVAPGQSATVVCTATTTIAATGTNVLAFEELFSGAPVITLNSVTNSNGLGINCAANSPDAGCAFFASAGDVVTTSFNVNYTLPGTYSYTVVDGQGHVFNGTITVATPVRQPGFGTGNFVPQPCYNGNSFCSGPTA